MGSGWTLMGVYHPVTWREELLLAELGFRPSEVLLDGVDSCGFTVLGDQREQPYRTELGRHWGRGRVVLEGGDLLTTFVFWPDDYVQRAAEAIHRDRLEAATGAGAGDGPAVMPVGLIRGESSAEACPDLSIGFGDQVAIAVGNQLRVARARFDRLLAELAPDPEPEKPGSVSVEILFDLGGFRAALQRSLRYTLVRPPVAAGGVVEGPRVY